MLMRKAAAPAREISAEAAAAMVRSGMWLDFGGSVNQPDLFDRALAARVGELTGVSIRSCLTTRPGPMWPPTPPGSASAPIAGTSACSTG